MSVQIITNSPSSLLTAFKKAMIEKRIVTWSCDSQGDFTHETNQWKNLAWFRPQIQSDRIVLNIIKPKNNNISREIYAIYHGRIIESFLAHFDESFKTAFATAIPENGDLI